MVQLIWSSFLSIAISVVLVPIVQASDPWSGEWIAEVQGFANEADVNATIEITDGAVLIVCKAAGKVSRWKSKLDRTGALNFSGTFVVDIGMNQHTFSVSGVFPKFHVVYENGGMGAGGGQATYTTDVIMRRP